MTRNYEYPFDHWRICANCGVTYDEKEEDCPECGQDERYVPDPDEKYDRRIENNL
jgi:rRNA maturation endonuclease Nob1